MYWTTSYLSVKWNRFIRACCFFHLFIIIKMQNLTPRSFLKLTSSLEVCLHPVNNQWIEPSLTSYIFFIFTGMLWMGKKKNDFCFIVTLNHQSIECSWYFFLISEVLLTHMSYQISWANVSILCFGIFAAKFWVIWKGVIFIYFLKHEVPPWGISSER